MTSCAFCNHPDREEYEREIASKAISMTKAAELMNSNRPPVQVFCITAFPRRGG